MSSPVIIELNLSAPISCLILGLRIDLLIDLSDNQKLIIIAKKTKTNTNTRVFMENYYSKSQINHSSLNLLSHAVSDALNKRFLPRVVQGLFLAGCIGVHSTATAIDDSQLNGKNGFNVEKIDINDRLYLREQIINDVNGDGIDDLLIDNSVFFNLQDAKTHIIFGATGNTIPAKLKLEDLDGANGFTINARFSGMIDINGDGITDIIVTDFTSVNPEKFIVFGQNVSAAEKFPSVVSLSDLNGTNGFHVVDPVNDGELSIASQGDLSGDGIDDMVVSERHSYSKSSYSTRYKTSLYVVFGREDSVFPANLSLSKLNGGDGLRINDAFQNYNGYDSSNRSFVDSDNRIDFNGDGINDLLYTERDFLGYSYLDTTHEMNFVDISALENNGEFPAVKDGLSEITFFSTRASVSGGGDPGDSGNIGDINGDGVDDIAQASDSSRRLTGSENKVVISFGMANNSVNPAGVKQIIFTDEFYSLSAESSDLITTALGDINGDGIDDVHLMSVNNSSNHTKHSFILFGRNTKIDGEFPENITPDFFDGHNGFILRGTKGISPYETDEKFQSVGDFNNDGINDIVYLNNEVTNSLISGIERRANIIYGQAEPFPEIVIVSELNDSSNVMTDEFSAESRNVRETLLADINNDGSDDLIMQSGFTGSVSVFYGASDILSTPKLVCPGDIDNDGEPELVVLFENHAANTLNAVVKDLNGRLVSTVNFNRNFKPEAIKALEDINNNRSPELVVIDQGTARAEVRDSMTGERLNTIGFHANGGALDIEPLADQNSNGAQALASLNDQGKVTVKDALNADTIQQLSFSTTNFVPQDLSVLETLPSQVAVLFENKDPLKLDKVTLKDVSTGRVVKNLWYGKGWDALQLEVLSDLNGNGSQEAAVLRTKGNQVNVLIRDSFSGRLISSQGHSTGYRPIGMAIAADLNNNGSQEVVVVGRKDQGTSVKATVKDGLNGELINTVFFNKNIKPLEFSVCPDMNGNNKPELVVLGERSSDGALHLIIKDAMTGQLVGKVEY